MRTARLMLLAVAGLCAAALPSLAAPFLARAQTADPSGPDRSVDATFTPTSPPGPCITVGGPATVDFGQLGFGSGFALGNASTVVASCGPPDRVQDVLVSVSDATALGIVQWTPFDCSPNPSATCVTPTNGFAYLLGGVSLTATPRLIVPAGRVDHQLRLPAPGSVGGGEVVRMTVTILGVLR